MVEWGRHLSIGDSGISAPFAIALIQTTLLYGSSLLLLTVINAMAKTFSFPNESPGVRIYR